MQLAICPLRKAKALGAFKHTWIGEFTSKNDLSTCFFLSFILVSVARMNVRFYWKNNKHWAFFMERLINYLCKSWYADGSILCAGRCITASGLHRELTSHRPQYTSTGNIQTACTLCKCLLNYNALEIWLLLYYCKCLLTIMARKFKL